MNFWTVLLSMNNLRIRNNQPVFHPGMIFQRRIFSVCVTVSESLESLMISLTMKQKLKMIYFLGLFLLHKPSHFFYIINKLFLENW